MSNIILTVVYSIIWYLKTEVHDRLYRRIKLSIFICVCYCLLVDNHYYFYYYFIHQQTINIKFYFKIKKNTTYSCCDLCYPSSCFSSVPCPLPCFEAGLISRQQKVWLFAARKYSLTHQKFRSERFLRLILLVMNWNFSISESGLHTFFHLICSYRIQL